MSRMRSIELGAILLVAIGAPLLTALFLSREFDVTVEPPPAEQVIHSELLANTAEGRAVDLHEWLRLAVQRPAAFAATVQWCEERTHLPLPNCRNVRIAAAASTAVPSSSEGGNDAD